ncbi:MAG TPA: UvrD-helicase domain-containing protein [Chloroflexi bacterium]|nr:UvrD-helicase domain-containing protein [Chloroflexota bacterium]
MDFRIADTFTDSLSRLNGDEQKAVKTTAFDLQLNPANPGMSFHKLDKVRDKNFWSVRVNSDIRLIVHRQPGSLLLCYVDHHDAAYAWAARRKLEVHPQTGAAQLVEVRERVEEIVIPRYVAEVRPAPPIFAATPPETLLRYGVPAEWVEEVRRVSEDGLLDLAEHLPAEAAEALLQLATGVTPPLPQTGDDTADPFEHPDAQRRFRMVRNVEELAAALDYPWEKWTVFLHPVQREAVERSYNGPARVSGSAGTGKTIVALHRAVYLARTQPGARVLLTTFSDTLANALRQKLKILLNGEPRLADQIEVQSLDAIARRLYELNFGRPRLATAAEVRQIVQAAAQAAGQPFPLPFVLAEWEHVVDAWQLQEWEAYRTVTRLGRRTRLTDKQRAALWAVFAETWAALQAQGLTTPAGLFSRLADHFAATGRSPFDAVVVDEAQDLSVAQLRFLAALSRGAANSLFFTGDLGQRIFQQPFSWKALGVDVRGRSRTLRVNYRTSHQIRARADRLLGPEVGDVDGNREDRRGTVSAFNGPEPTIKVLDTEAAECAAVRQWLSARLAEGIAPHEIGVFVRTAAQLPRAQAAVAAAALPYKVLDDHVETTSGHVSISTMHLAKGLEFRAVVVMACDDEVIPLQERIETAGDESELEEVYNTERHLLYVASTRARDHLLVTSVRPASEFLDDLRR